MEFKKVVAAIVFVGTSYIALAQTEGVSIKSSVSPPHPSAMLDVESSNKGMLAPRVSLVSTDVATPVSNPAVSLLVYNTAVSGTYPHKVVPGFYFWDGSSWRKLVAEEAGTSQGGVVPMGGIIMWSGNPMTVPTGYQLCDGNAVTNANSPMQGQNTPALQGRFIVSYDANDTDYSWANTGKIGPDNPNTTDYELTNGGKMVKLKIPAMPIHHHPGQTDIIGSAVTASGTTGPGSEHTHAPGIMANPLNMSINRVDKHGDIIASVGFGPVPIEKESAHTHPLTGSLTLDGTLELTLPDEGNEHGIENRPPYYTLAYIIRIY